MTHLSEGANRLRISQARPKSLNEALRVVSDIGDVCLLRLPAAPAESYSQPLEGIGDVIAAIATKIGSEATIVILGDVVDLVHSSAAMPKTMRYQTWVAIKRSESIDARGVALPHYHFGALVYTGYQSSLRHVKTRVEYTYCPACDKTTKDYGGKKHTYHEFGTLMSDVWRDIACDLNGDLDAIYHRFADLFAVEPYKQLSVIDLRSLGMKRTLRIQTEQRKPPIQNGNDTAFLRANQLLLGDCLTQMKTIPDNSVDFAFADPPYNLGKHYSGYSDDRAISEYFDWCDKWVDELSRILRQGRTCAILNIPLWAMRHFLHMETMLTFQNWIVWDALSFPVRHIMPSHYAIVCFSKGEPRDLPGTSKPKSSSHDELQDPFDSLTPLAETFCLRERCINKRKNLNLNDCGPLTDLWWDIHRLKHNARRVDHPCQLPPQLMYRLISVFTEPDELVLDCFNGAGTTTLAAHQLGRHYIGIEISEQYNSLAAARHREISNGIDPFRKEEKELTSKNSPVRRLPKQKYQVTKKALQLEVKRIATLLDHKPNREEVKKYGKYPIDYYDKYFVSWGEVCAAARTTGMTEDRKATVSKALTQQTTLSQ